jgi:N-dimethylarginine dimethylaminohydrolase
VAAGNVTKLWGGHSMVAPLRRVLVFAPVPPGPEVSWEAFGYLHPIEHQLAVEEHATFRRILTDAGCEVVTGEIDDARLQDGIFPYDPSFTTDAGAILLRPGKTLRLGEVAMAERTYAEIGVPIAGRISAPGTVDGGDCCWLDERTMLVGRGYRTNSEGIRQLTAILARQDVQVVAFDLPHWHGRGEVLHLLSLISPVAERLAVVYLPLMPVALVELLEVRGYTLIEIPDEEFFTQGSNVLALAPGKVVILRENRVTARRLREAGCEVTLLAGDEMSHNRTGGPTCLTRPLLRVTVR